MSEIVNLLGNKLATILEKPEKASRGLIRLAFKDRELQEKLEANKLTLSETLKVLNGTLQERLKQIKAQNPEEISTQLKQFITKHQSIFTMSK